MCTRFQDTYVVDFANWECSRIDFEGFRRLNERDLSEGIVIRDRVRICERILWFMQRYSVLACTVYV